MPPLMHSSRDSVESALPVCVSTDSPAHSLVAGVRVVIVEGILECKVHKS